jgi:hypothetical protein
MDWCRPVGRDHLVRLPGLTGHRRRENNHDPSSRRGAVNTALSLCGVKGWAGLLTRCLQHAAGGGDPHGGGSLRTRTEIRLASMDCSGPFHTNRVMSVSLTPGRCGRRPFRAVMAGEEGSEEHAGRSSRQVAKRRHWRPASRDAPHQTVARPNWWVGAPSAVAAR